MPSQTSQPLTVTLLAALWLSLGRCGAFQCPGCDNGKLCLDKDLPADGAHWDCAGSHWPESTQRPHSVDTVDDPVPARQICMDESISYNRSVPSSGAYRPVGAENGEYFYCPPQRWLNNLHHGATVLLFHPCAPLRDRLLLSALARSCLQDYVVTSHPQLSEHMPVALVSWGHSLESSTAASSDVCDWLETTASTINKLSAASQNRKYNLLLRRSAVQRRAHSAKKESLRRCCERTVSVRPREESKSRETRSTMSRTEDVHNYEDKLGSSENSTSRNRTEAPQSKIQNTNQGLTLRATTPLGPHIPETSPRSDSLGFRTPESQKLQRADRPGGLESNSKDEGQKDEESAEHGRKEKNLNEVNRADGSMKDKEVVDVKERELEHTHGASQSHHSRDRTGSRSASKAQTQFPQQQNAQPASYPPNSEDSGAAVRGLPRTPRTDEAVWAAAALGFLLVLLTLSVLHTRLYRHWRTPPSLYWHNPQQDYDSVADVIRRRLRIANRRRKRSRRQEYVLLPSSSSSDEFP